MKPLLSVVAALLIIRLDPLIAAPQPLSLLNSTDIDDEGTVTTNSSKADEDVTKLSNLGSVSGETSTATLSPILPVNDHNEKSADVFLDTEITPSESNPTESRSDSNLNTEEVLEETTNKQDDAKLTTRANEGVDMLTTRSDSVDTPINNFSDYAKQPDGSIGEVISKDDIPEEVTISRYVPPLDPMKHMLMMAEVRKQLELSSTTETSEISSTILPVNSEHTEVDSENNAEEIEKDALGPSELEKLSITPTVSETFNSSSDPLSIKYSDELIPSEADKLDGSFETSTEMPTTIPNTVPKVTEITSLVDSSDISHENVSLILNSELLSGRNESLILGTSTEIDESKESDSIEQTQPTTFSEPSTTITTLESHSTDAIHSSTDIKSEESIEELSLVRSDDEPLSVEISESEEITTVQPSESTSPNNKELGSSASNEIPSSSVVYSDSVITTTFKPELTTNEVLEKLSASEVETSKNVTLEEELEFREGNVFFNASNVTYHDETTNSALKLAEGNDDYSSTENFSSENKETTTLGFFTTIRDIVFGSSTITPEVETENPSAESSDLNSTLLENAKPAENFAYSDTGDLADVRSESDLPDGTPSSDLTKIELIKEEVDSISTDSPHILSSTISDNEPTTDQYKDDSSTVATEKESSSENVKVDPTSTEKEEFVSTNEELETTTVSEILTTEKAPEKSELLKSSDPESIIEISNETTTENYPKTDEELLVKSSTKDRYVSGNNTDSVAAVQFLHYHDKASSEQCFKLVDAHWKYATNLTDENKKKQVDFSVNEMKTDHFDTMRIDSLLKTTYFIRIMKRDCDNIPDI
ncbi:uncharacterized protein TNIN_288831 [Trichonephila inaurata madagascariensis]|uniref:Uncharacterized protein n=1 Tax=Trichonephila inaurata madagascariensis TaxID=2747483 RepID=A0A8X7BR28_9ARAC|nr:uncharacterized protein TNIN_288831 [Trichonephila inaurata madagascariensis]